MHAGWSVCGDLPPKRYRHWVPLECMHRQARASQEISTERWQVSHVWQRARRKRGKANQPGLRSVAPSFGLANHRAVGDLSPLTEIA